MDIALFYIDAMAAFFKCPSIVEDYCADNIYPQINRSGDGLFQMSVEGATVMPCDFLTVFLSTYFVFFLCNIRYPPKLFPVWMFFQKFVLEINFPDDKVPVKVAKVISLLCDGHDS